MRRPDSRDPAELRRVARVFGAEPFVADHEVQAPAHDRVWLYAAADYELALLRRIVAEGFAANRNVHYADNYARPRAAVEFRRLPGDEDDVVIRVDDGDVGDVCTFAVADADEAARWMVVEADGTLSPATWRPGSEHPPHLDDEPTIRLPVTVSAAVSAADEAADVRVFDAGATVLGRPVVRADGRVRISTGESIPEALSTGPHETRHDMVAGANGCWTSEHRLGFRYLVVHGAEVEAADVTVEASLRPSPEPGLFICSDDALNRIWATAAYTIRLCMQGLVVDGVKRDRMPWIGDLALTTISTAFTVGDGTIVRDGLVALGRPTGGYVNGIADYSLWWVIGQSLHQRYFADAQHLAREAAQIERFMGGLLTDCDGDGVFRPRAVAGGFEGLADGAVLIDWGVSIEPGRDLTALQVLWFWAQRSAAELLEAGGRDQAAGEWRMRAAATERMLHRTAWDPQATAWREYCDPHADVSSPYPNLLAVLAGLRTSADDSGVLRSILDEPVATPFMSAFSLRALARLGAHVVALSRIRSQWQPMVDAGATTFWEEFASAGRSPYEMYGREFGRSLAHAWGAGPAALLPEIVLGLEPVADGWSRFRVEPRLEAGALDWATAYVPTPFGTIVITADESGAVVDVPAGAALVTPSGDVVGPARVALAAP